MEKKIARMKSLLRFFANEKKGLEIEMSVVWIIAIAVMIIVIVLFIDVKDAWGSAIDYVKNFLRFGR